jgi:hypothetical protein
MTEGRRLCTSTKRKFLCREGLKSEVMLSVSEVRCKVSWKQMAELGHGKFRGAVKGMIR